MNEQKFPGGEEMPDDSGQKVNVEELQKMVEEKKEDTEPNYVSIGLAIGLCLGCCLGVVFNNLSLGLGIGTVAGIAVGVFLAYKNVKIDEDQPEREDEKTEK